MIPEYQKTYYCAHQTSIEVAWYAEEEPMHEVPRMEKIECKVIQIKT